MTTVIGSFRAAYQLYRYYIMQEVAASDKCLLIWRFTLFGSGLHKKAGSQGVHTKGVHVNPGNPAGKGAALCIG